MPFKMVEQDEAPKLTDKTKATCERLESESTCRSIFKKETEVLFAVHKDYKNLTEVEKARRFIAAKRNLGEFLSQVYMRVKENYAKEGGKIPPQTYEEVELLFTKISKEVWSRFKPAPQSLPQIHDGIRGVDVWDATVDFLFESFDPGSKKFGILDCDTSALLFAELMNAFDMPAVALVPVKKHALLFVSLKEKDCNKGKFFQTTALQSGNTVEWKVYNSEDSLKTLYPECVVISKTPFSDENSCTYLARGNAYFDAGDLLQSIKEYIKSLCQVDKYIEVNDYHNIAVAFILLEDKREASTVINNYMRNLPFDLEEAISNLEKAVQEGKGEKK
ncbi:hypothetical protein COV61_02540 [Candidatus Micrarchaeota archaeon CG11_big_fil_rev_8_21_14_0_20_47_5]|nr:MAG: hypothetical protein AUJ17_04775 [Candidatus Micrarchaeota archaeon CG1_02_47_40]PIN83643.1 MAG: hypothetical protein COV61_02540 [Candidatus Micrarchaeota archaeon CG11_big_fil_rev_8_21_14_0_20_47_5]